MSYFRRLTSLVLFCTILMLVALAPTTTTLSAANSSSASPSVTPVEIAPGVKAYLTAPSTNDPEQIVRNYLLANLAEYQLTEADVNEYVVTDRYVARHTGVTRLYFRQKVNGIEIFGANLNAHVLPDGRILTLNNQFVPNLNRVNVNAQPDLTAIEATTAAALHLGLELTSPLVVESNLGGPAQNVVLSSSGISQEPIPAKLVYFANEKGELTLAWELVIGEYHRPNWWQMQVSASSGMVLNMSNWIVSESWGTPSKTNTTTTSTPATTNSAAIFEVATANQAEAVAVGGDGSTYKVYQMPVESPNHTTPLPPADGRTTVGEPADIVASPFGWHDTNGAAGAEFTTTQGNNVHAYTDLDNDNLPDAGSSPDGGAGLDFDFPVDLTQPPSAYRPAAVTNLFYWNNIMHDVPYVYGFDEVAGNFQENNYGRGGLGGDYVDAQAQDGGGTNNANFFTPVDGQNPRMQMYIWTAPTPDKDGDFDNGIIAHEYGHGISIRLTGGPSNVSCLNNSEQMGEGWSDWQSVILTMRPGDTSTTVRGVGTYALDQATNGNGIRPAPYTTDMGVNGYTYADTSTLAVPHGVGFVWATMVWEMNWALINEYGFEPDIYNWDAGNWDAAGNTLAYYLVQEGMAIQPCNPGFVDGRNAILAADQALTGGANACLIWTAFAKRGLGFGATQGSTSSNSDNVEAFDIPTFCQTLGVDPVSQNICQGETAVYEVTIGSSYVGSVNMSAVGNPATTTATFNPNPVTVIPGSTDLTIGNTAAAAPGTYTVTVTGSDGTTTDDIDAWLTVYAGAPGATSLTTPANGALDVDTAPALSWQAVAGASEYNVEIATDAGFTNVVYTATETTTTHNVASNLAADTEYFWRVTTVNPCGIGTTSSVFSFTTVNIICRQPNLPLPDDPDVSDVMTVANTGTLTDLNVIIRANHTWVGDMRFTLVHTGGASVTMIDRPGTTGSGAGCANNNVDVLLDDEGTDGPVENQCSATPPALFGNPTPNNPLSAFDGEDLSGTWTLNYSDGAGADTGTLLEWCLVPTFAADTFDVNVTAPVMAQNADEGQTITYTVEVENTGTNNDTYDISVMSSEEWPATSDQTSLAVNAGETGSLEITIMVPVTATGGTVDTTTVTAVSQGDNGVSDSVDLLTTVNMPVMTVEVDAAVTSQNTDADTTITYTVDITNTGDVDDVYNISAVSSEGWSGTINPTSVTLNAGASASVEVAIVVPSSAAGGTVDTTTVTAVSQASSSVNDSVDLLTTVNDPDLAFTPAELEATVDFTSTATQTLTIMNNGGSALDWSIVEEGSTQLGGCTAVDIPWLTLSATSGTTMMGESTAIDVVFDSTGYAAGEYTGQLCLESNDPTVTANTVAITMTVLEGIYSMEMMADTMAQDGPVGTTITYTVWVTNTGNVNDTYTVELSGHSWDTEASHTTINLAAGETGEVMIMVTVPMTATSGMTDTTMLMVTSQGDDTVSEMMNFTTTAVANIMYNLYLPVINREP